MQSNNTNANGTFREKGLSVGSQIRCFKLTSGNKSDGSMWGLINHVEKDGNKNIVQKYSLWLANDSQFIATFPSDKTVDVRIESIKAIRPEFKTYTNSKTGQKVNERILNLIVTISIVQVIDNNYNNTNNYMNNNNYNNNNYNNNYNNDYMNDGNNYNQAPQNNQPNIPINQQQTFSTNPHELPNKMPKNDNANDLYADLDIDDSQLPF